MAHFGIHGDRLALRQHVRHQMISRGLLDFCDQDEPRDKQAWDRFRRIQDHWTRLSQEESLRWVAGSY